MKNCHQQNLVEIFHLMEKVAGWGVLEQDGLLALKSPVSFPFANFAWGEATPAALARVKAFYGDLAFSWVLDEGQEGDAFLREAGFRAPETAPDMVLDLEGYAYPGHGPEIRLLRAYSSQDFRFWSATAAEALGLDVEAMRAFFLPLVREAGCVPFLALCEGVPAATSMAFCGGGTTGIYAVGTRESFRRRGLGQAVTHACLRAAQHHGSPRAVLSASAMGLPVYRKLGFRIERTVREYAFRPERS